MRQEQCEDCSETKPCEHHKRHTDLHNGAISLIAKSQKGEEGLNELCIIAELVSICSFGFLASGRGKLEFLSLCAGIFDDQEAARRKGEQRRTLHS